MALLTQLARLTIYSTGYSSTSMAALSCLSALTYLSLYEMENFPSPATLAKLTSLCHLCIYMVPMTAAELHVALLPLQQLTCLSLGGADSMHSIPAAVASLPQLQRLVLYHMQLATALPLPHSLRSLRYLAINWGVAAASLPAFAALLALEQLWLADMPLPDDVAREPFWEWAATHPPLQLLCMQSDDIVDGPPASFDACAFAKACLRLARRRPALTIGVEHDGPHDFLDLLDE